MYSVYIVELEKVTVCWIEVSIAFIEALQNDMKKWTHSSHCDLG